MATFPRIIDTATVELKAVISSAEISSIDLVRFVAGQEIAIASTDDMAIRVVFTIEDRRVAQARLRIEDGRLVATIVDLTADDAERKPDRWSLQDADSP